MSRDPTRVDFETDAAMRFQESELDRLRNENAALRAELAALRRAHQELSSASFAYIKKVSAERVL